MGMPIVVDVRDDVPCDAALDALVAWFHEVDARYSTYKEDSEISRYNRGELTPAELSDEMRWVLDRCEELRAETRGFFDVRAASPTLVDPSGLVKGWSVARGAEILEAAGLRDFQVNAGGDIVVRGGAMPADHWRVGIQHPLEHDRIAEVVPLTDAAIATSGEYARGQHVLDPHTGRPPHGLLSVTIVGPDLATADAYATAVFAMGAAGPAWTASLPAKGYEALCITAEQRVLRTPGCPVDGNRPGHPSEFIQTSDFVQTSAFIQTSTSE
jgi:thiamine biosynthesis lipoprotein